MKDLHSKKVEGMGRRRTSARGRTLQDEKQLLYSHLLYFKQHFGCKDVWLDSVFNLYFPNQLIDTQVRSGISARKPNAEFIYSVERLTFGGLSSYLAANSAVKKRGMTKTEL